jgi:hypothetical protein
MLGERRAPGRVIRSCAFDYQRQVEMIMNAPQGDSGRHRERLATAAVLLAIAVSLAGAGVVIVESSSEPPQQRASAAATE